MVLHMIHADILLIPRIFPRPFGPRKNASQLAKYLPVLYEKPWKKKTSSYPAMDNYSGLETNGSQLIIHW